LRLPYLTGTLRVPLNIAIPVNLAVSLATLIAALPTRLYTLRTMDLVPFLYQTGSLAVGAILGAYIGVNWLRGLSATALKRAVFTLLLALGVVMIAEAFIAVTPLGLLPRTGAFQIISGLVLGFAVGAISGLLGVAGGEVIIPILVLGFGAPIKAAGSLSQIVSIPTVLTSFARHLRAGAISNRKINTHLVLPMSTFIPFAGPNWAPQSTCPISPFHSHDRFGPEPVTSQQPRQYAHVTSYDRLRGD
jgi:uncharacterized protein